MSDQKLAIFDIDGTLITMWPMHEKVYESMFRELYNVPNVNFRKYYKPGESNEDDVRKSLGALGYSKDFIEPKIALVKPTMQKYYSLYGKDAEVKLLPGVNALLDKLVEEKVTAVVVTGNYHSTANFLLKKAGLTKYFPFIIGADQSEVREKRIEEAIRMAESSNGIRYEPKNIFFFDDSDGSVPISRKLGITSISVATGDVSYERLKAAKPDHLLRDLSDTDGILKILIKAHGGKKKVHT
jgi:phosphoglycolate phosphatase-like HAD superfamily hydrolase